MTKINDICDENKDDLLDSFATAIREKKSSKDIKTINQEARSYINPIWKTEKTNLVSGKTILSSLFDFLSTTYNISTNKFNIAREIKVNELSKEVIDVIDKIENKEKF